MCKCVVAEFFQHKVTVTLVYFYFLTVIMLLAATNSDKTETTCTHISTDNFVFFISLKIYS